MLLCSQKTLTQFFLSKTKLSNQEPDTVFYPIQYLLIGDGFKKTKVHQGRMAIIICSVRFKDRSAITKYNPEFGK